MLNGDPIEPLKDYRVVLPNFLLRGGDDFSQVVTWYKPRDQIDGIEVREAILNYLETHKRLNTEDDPLIDPHNPPFFVLDENGNQKEN